MPRKKTAKKPPEANINCYVPKQLRERLDKLVQNTGSKIKHHIAAALRLYLPAVEKQMQDGDG